MAQAQAQKMKAAPRKDHVYEREVYKTKGGTYLIFTPYKHFQGKKVWFSMKDLDYKSWAVAKEGKITVKLTDFHRFHPGKELEGATVIVGLEEKNEEIVDHINKEYTI